MTIAELAECRKPFLMASDIAPILDCDPQGLRVQARENPAALGFPVTVIGKRVRIPTKAFKDYVRQELGMI